MKIRKATKKNLYMIAVLFFVMLVFTPLVISVDENIGLTEGEKVWLEEHPVIRVYNELD